MPRPSYGPKPEARTQRLLEALLLYVHGELDGCEYLEIKYEWQERGDRPKLIIETKLRILEALTRKDGKKGSLTTTQIRESLHRMEYFLEILEDNRVQKKGLEEWRFTLTLWSKDDIDKNLERFKQEWEQRRPAKGKQHNAEQTNTSKKIEKPCGKIRSAVPLIPAYFVDRPKIKLDVKELLLEKVATSGMLAIGAIQGLGGIGKTTLASHLIQDLEVQRRFPDGILWVTLGQTPDLLPLLSQWVRDLEDYDFKPTTVEMTSTHLRRLLVDKTVLLVIDDVWEEEHIEPFLVGNDNCRVLVTTRRLHVAEARGARLYQLDLMSPEQSLELFSNRLNRSLKGEEKEQAEAMAEAVGYLPLALELAVARINRGVTWTDLCVALKEEVARLEILEDPRQRRRNDLKLMASFNLSLEALRTEDEILWQRFVWLGVLPEDATIAAPMTSTLWQAELLEADEDLELLYSDALLLSDSPVIVGDKEWRAYRLHDLVHDIARKLLTTESPPDPPTLGGMRVEASPPGPPTLGGMRTEGSSDLYPDESPPRQPTLGGMRVESSSDLYPQGMRVQSSSEAECPPDPPTLGGMRVQNSSDAECPPRQPTLGGMRVQSPSNLLPEGMRVQSPPELGDLGGKGGKGSGAITGLGLTLPEAHSLLLERYLSKIPHQLWHELADDSYIHDRLTWHIEKAEKTELLHQLLQEETSEGRNGWYEACERLGKTGNFVQDVGRAWQWAEKIYEQDSTLSISLQYRYALIFATLNNLASNIPPELLAALVKTRYWQPTQGLAYIQQMQDSGQRASALTKLVPYLPDTLLSVALEVTRSIQDDYYRAEALSSLADKLPPELLAEALELTRSIQDESDRARALSSLADKLPELLAEALELTRSIQDESDRARALSSLADKLPELLPEALEVTRSIQDEFHRAIALSSLARKLPELLPEALEVTRSIQDEFHRAIALSSLANKLPPELLAETLEVTRSIQDEFHRARALSSLARKLPELWPEALELTRSIQDEFHRAIAFSSLAHKLPELLPEALEVTRSLQDESDRARALSSLADKLPELLPEALEVTRSLQDEKYRAIALSSLADKLPEHLLPEALELTRSLQDEKYRAWALSSLARKLPEHLLPEALELTRSLQDEYQRARALSSLAHKLPELLPEALEVTRSIQDEFHRAIALSSLADKLPELLPEALEVTRSLQDEKYRAWALSSLADKLPEHLLPEALELTRSIQDESDRAWALSSLARKLPELWPEALEVTRSIQDESDRAWALSSLADKLPEHLLPEALELTRSLQDEKYRAWALSSLARKLPEHLLPEALELTRSLQDEYQRARALSSLAHKLPELLPEALEVTRSIQDESDRARALSSLARKLPELWPEALEVTRSLQDEYHRAIALSSLADKLPPELLAEALEVTRSIQSEEYRAIALSSLLPRLNLSDWNKEFWQENLHILARRKRQELMEDLTKLSPVIEFLGGLEALRSLATVMRDVCQQWP